MFDSKQTLMHRLADAVDLAIDFATLGEYGLRSPLGELAEIARPIAVVADGNGPNASLKTFSVVRDGMWPAGEGAEGQAERSRRTAPRSSATQASRRGR